MKIIKQLYVTLFLIKTYFFESLHFYYALHKFNASWRTDRDIQKMQYTLLRENHIIEKGMSMRKPRKGFGQEKVLVLLTRLDKYVTYFGSKDMDFIVPLLSTIKKYIVYTKEQGVQIDNIEKKFNNIISRTNIKNIQPKGGIKEIISNDIITESLGNFESLLYSRHSVRYFKNEPVSKELLDKALKLAQQTPSACNRQTWSTHVYFNNKSYELLKWQGGCNGFEDEIKCCVLVTANLKGFIFCETHQAYVDGGMYAMNLLNAFHFLGMATIPISCGFTNTKLKKLSKFNIPNNEIPVVIIGVGHHLDKYNVAISQRKDITETNLYH